MDRILQKGTPLRKNRKQITIAKIEKKSINKSSRETKIKMCPESSQLN